MARTRQTSSTLQGPELDAWRALMRAYAAVSRQLEVELETAEGLPLRSFTVLLELDQAPDQRLRMSDLADAAGLSRSGLSRLIDRLVADRLIERAECDDDGRGSFAVLTAAGAARLGAARRTHSEAVRRALVDHFTTSELREFSRYLRRVID
jgi:DNA-binding MarR family transcriptional regulator